MPWGSQESAQGRASSAQRVPTAWDADVREGAPASVFHHEAALGYPASQTRKAEVEPREGPGARSCPPSFLDDFPSLASVSSSEDEGQWAEGPEIRGERGLNGEKWSPRSRDK